MSDLLKSLFGKKKHLADLAAAITGRLTREWREQKVAEASPLADEMTDLNYDNPITSGDAWPQLSSKLAAASCRSLHASSQRRDASATFSFACPTN